MKYMIYSVYDMASESYMSPFFMRTEAEAMRGFNTACNSTDNPIGQYPADYHLYKIGEFTDHNGDLRKQQPEVIISGTECIQKTKPKE